VIRRYRPNGFGFSPPVKKWNPSFLPYSSIMHPNFRLFLSSWHVVDDTDRYSHPIDERNVFQVHCLIPRVRVPQHEKVISSIDGWFRHTNNSTTTYSIALVRCVCKNSGQSHQSVLVRLTWKSSKTNVIGLISNGQLNKSQMVPKFYTHSGPTSSPYLYNEYMVVIL
jgi:hypothetical protein